MYRFFSKAEEDIIIRAIRRVEKNSECEFRVHVDFADPHVSPIDAAIKAFNKLQMQYTRYRNGVLILILPERNEYAIIGDIGINSKVSSHYWNDVYDLMKAYYVDGRYVLGTVEAIEMIGLELVKYFPSERDHNELPDEISYTRK
ncbi:MAG: TPM domain-containing protein [Saprospiraceae bacterium]|nr:TPM domain-containing protein [Saprospiraceae bacterium]